MGLSPPSSAGIFAACDREERWMAGPSRERPEPERHEVWARVRGETYRGVYSAADGWVEVIADNGLTKTGRCGDSSAAAVAERLLRELYRAGG
jgi:hypothetical protein